MATKEPTTRRLPTSKFKKVACPLNKGMGAYEGVAVCLRAKDGKDVIVIVDSTDDAQAAADLLAPGVQIDPFSCYDVVVCKKPQ